MNKKLFNNLVLVLVIVGGVLATIFLVSHFSSLGLAAAIALIVGIIVFIRVLKNPFWGFLLLIFFLPFERIPSIDLGLITLKINQFIGSAVLLSWAGLVLTKNRKITYNPLTWPIVIFLTICFISIFFAGNVSRALEVFAFTTFMALISFMVVNMIDSERAVEGVIKILFWSTLVVCLFSFYQFFADLIGLDTSLSGLKEGYTKAVFGFPRVMAFSNEPLYLANFLFIPLGIGLSMFLEKINLIKRSYLFILLSMILLVFVLTVSRGAYIGFVAMVLIIAVFMARRIFSWKNILIALVVAGLVSGGILYFLSKSEPQAYDEFIKHVTLNDITAGESIWGRVDTFAKAIQIWQDHPIIGIGIGNYGPFVKGFPDPSTVNGWDIVNNQYIETLAETGILGLISFVMIFVVLFWRSSIAYFRSKSHFLKTVLVGLVAALAATLVQYNSFSTLYIMHIWVLIGLVVAVQNLLFRPIGKESAHENK